MPDVLLAGRYRLLDVVGRGGMGAVWRARDDVLDREVAVKEVLTPPGASAEPAGRDARRYARTMREARSAARLRHPSIITVYDVVTHDERPWIVMEFVPGRALSDVLKGGPLPPPRAAEIGSLMLAGLRAAHAAGVTHRDVKPGNVLLDGDRVILTDFGIAVAEDMTALTASGAILGTPSYMAPEQARSGTASAASDLWSLGATLYAAVEGRPPFTGPTAVAILSALLTEDPRPPLNAGPLRPVLDGLLCKDPSRRMDGKEAAALLSDAARAEARVVLPPPALVTGAPSLDDLPCPVETLVFAPDGRTLVTALPAGHGLPAAWIWDVDTGRLLHAVPRSEDCEDDARAVFLPDGRLIVGDGARFSITRPGAEEHETGEMAFAPDARYLAVAARAPGTAEHRIEFWDTGLMERRNILAGQRETPRNLIFSWTGSRLLSWGCGGQPQLWDPSRRFRSPLLATLRGHAAPRPAQAFAWAKHLATTDGATLLLWTARQGDGPVARLDGHTADINRVAFGLRDRIAMTASDDGTVRVWNPLAATRDRPETAHVATLTGHRGPVTGLAVNTDGTGMATAGHDRSVRLWDLTDRAPA
ncbi:WD40 repeat domain-containing serine/threonine protein kinase [Spirillospora sp. CA-142024]|uniref:WD40 repeat domain-containing serine/threonine protein kinase n=1 Tax=Spirillospora sp. CA-142024 TaxID=3240036 RepID=UPI003D8A888B